jgi:hypothetical protein
MPEPSADSLDGKNIQRTFAFWQPTYAKHRIATFPVRADKKPAISHYQKVGLRGSQQLAFKFAAANAFAFMCGPRSRITVLDVDTTDERVLADALDRHGRTPVVVHTASSKWHAYYRHNGERRRIRPWPDLAIDLLGANGFVIAPPSQTESGCYQFTEGSLDDLDRLPIMCAVENDNRPPAMAQPDSASPLRGMRDHDGRNRALFLAIGPPAREIFAAGKSRDALFEIAVSHNREAREPMAVEELNKVVDSVWQMTCEGHNWIGQRERRERELSRFKDAPDAHYLLEYLRVTEGISAEFWIANGLADIFGWTRQRLANARDCLVELGYVEQARRPYQGHPAVFVWPGWTRPF